MPLRQWEQVEPIDLIVGPRCAANGTCLRLLRLSYALVFAKAVPERFIRRSPWRKAMQNQVDANCGVCDRRGCGPDAGGRQNDGCAVVVTSSGRFSHSLCPPHLTDRMGHMSNGLIEMVANLPRTRIVLVGDLMLDRYIFGNAERLSPEAPVPILHFQREEYRLGGAGSVLADLAALRAHVKIIGILGKDEAAAEVRRRLTSCGADASGVIEVPDRPTVTKLRLVGSAQHR